MSDGLVYWEDVEEGAEIPTFQRKTDIMHWNRYAAVNDEFVYIHMDADYAKSIGQPDVFGMGNLRLAYLHNMLRSWVGEEGDQRSEIRKRVESIYLWVVVLLSE